LLGLTRHLVYKDILHSVCGKNHWKLTNPHQMCINMGINCLLTEYIRLVTMTILLKILSMNYLMPNIEATSPHG
jgi:hypothetical protein